MEKSKMLSGYDLVARGTTKLDATLPEIGLKDVQPNGSWLEQKQIQSALEARKKLIEVERIEKSGSISHAEWREELMLAEVTQKVGGYWQYFGHNMGKKLFLKPEEALFLIEVNSLLLTYNDVTVSLQQAYSLLLRGPIKLFHYKVYASLSRVGYKVFRHEGCTLTEYEAKLNLTKAVKNPFAYVLRDTNVKAEDFKNKVQGGEMDTGGEPEILRDESKKVDCNEESKSEDVSNQNNIETAMDIDSENLDSKQKSEIKLRDKSGEVDSKEESKEDTASQNNVESAMFVGNDNLNAMAASDDNYSKNQTVKSDEGGNNSSNETSLKQVNEIIDLGDVSDLNNDVMMIETSEKDVLKSHASKEDTSKDLPSNLQNNSNNTMINQSNMPRSKLRFLENRIVRPCDSSSLQKCFENVPDLFQKHVVTVNAPAEDHIPKNIFLNQTCYVLSIDKIKVKNTRRPSSSEPGTYSMGVEVNAAHVGRVRDSCSQSQPHQNWQQTLNSNRFSRFQPSNLRPFNFWRPQMCFPFQHNLFQRPFLPNVLFVPRLHMFRHQYPFANISGLTNFDPYMNNSRNYQRKTNKRKRTVSNSNKHLEAIKRLSVRLRELARLDPTNQTNNVQSLQRLIGTYNLRYKSKLFLTEDYEIIDNSIVETIELDCDDEPKNKKPKSDYQGHYTENFNKLKQLAMQLKELESKGEATSRQRRAFSSVLKNFNKTYQADVIMNGKFELHDRSLISLDSSSDSDCVIEETPVTPSGKKLRNPFNILNRLATKRDESSPVASTSNGDRTETLPRPTNKYSETLLKTFDKNWLPNEDDFGRAEVISGNVTLNYLIDYRKDEFIYEYIRGQNYEFNNWLEVKLAFFTSITESESNHMTEDPLLDNDSDLKPIIGPEDSTDFPSVLKKLSIISANKDVKNETNLRIDFDVYNRDVQNFRKSNRPKPHFRVVCVEESSPFPSGLDIATLHSKYTDNVVILFAVVGVGSVSYLQMNPSELPVYVPGNTFDLP